MNRVHFLRALGGGALFAVIPRVAEGATLEERVTSLEARVDALEGKTSTQVVKYLPDTTTDIRNPGRGKQNSYENAPGLLSNSGLGADSHTNPRRYWYLPPTDAPLTNFTINAIRSDLAYAVSAGKLLDGRFAYSHGVGEPEPPYSRILQHLDQLLPVISQYHYVFRTLEIGFLGPWGEVHSIRSAGWTDPDAHDSGPRPQLAIFLNRVLDGTPPNLFIAMRYQHHVRQLIAAGQISIPKQARIALYNDGFLHSWTQPYGIVAFDNGTFPDAWSGPTYDDPVGRAWVKAWAETHPSRAESDIDSPDGAAWALIGNNAIVRGFEDGRIDNLREWGLQGIVLDPKGITAEVYRRLGYRLVLTEGRFGSGFFELDFRNDGFAAPRRNYLARVNGVMAQMSKPATSWVPGAHTVRFTVPTSGKIALELIDPNPELDKAQYKIRFANQGTWDAGRNLL